MKYVKSAYSSKYTCKCGEVHGNNEMVPNDQKIVGHKYLEHCGHYHTWDPLPAGVTFEDLALQKAINRMAEEEDKLWLEAVLKDARDTSKT